MTASDLTILLEIQPGREPALRAVLQSIGAEVSANPYFSFASFPELHFGRFTLLGSDRLLVNFVHDGPANRLLESLPRRAPGLTAVLEHCVGFPGLESPTAFARWFQPQTFPADIFFRAHPYTVRQVRAFLALADRLDDLLARPDLEPFLDLLSHVPFNDSPPPRPGRLTQLAGKLAGGATDLLLAALRWPQTRLAGRIAPTARRAPALTIHTPCWLTDRAELVQNEMTIMLPVHPRLRGYLRTILTVAGKALQNPPPDGTLAGVSTVHFGRWMMADGGRNLLFVSNYDGSWETYIGEVASDRVGRGLDLIWGCCEGYHATGAGDIQTFKQVIIDHQYRAEAFYSAYPQHSARNVIRAIRVAESLGALFEREPLRTLLQQF